MKKLVITGCGIKTLSHLTRENEAVIREADLVLFLVNEPIIAKWIDTVSKKCESLEHVYFSETIRSNAYKKITESILGILKNNNNVCLVVYGHPSLLCDTASLLVEKIDRTSTELVIIPGISTFDCIIADLEIDPLQGCFVIEANQLLKKNHNIDRSNHVIIWQIGLVEDGFSTPSTSTNINKLKNKLLENYNPDCECVLYEASLYPHIPSKKNYIKLGGINAKQLTRLTTLYIPPCD